MLSNGTGPFRIVGALDMKSRGLKPRKDMEPIAREQAFLFDLDGTLVDSVYQHVLAWQDALERGGIELSVWRIHRKIGMSGGLFTNDLLQETGREVTSEEAALLRKLHAEAYAERSHLIRPLPGARELLYRMRACLGRLRPVAISRAPRRS